MGVDVSTDQQSDKITNLVGGLDTLRRFCCSAARAVHESLPSPRDVCGKQTTQNVTFAKRSQQAICFQEESSQNTNPKSRQLRHDDKRAWVGSADRLPQLIRMVLLRGCSAVSRERTQAMFRQSGKGFSPSPIMKNAYLTPPRRLLLRSRERSRVCCEELSPRSRAHGWQRLFAADQAD